MKFSYLFHLLMCIPNQKINVNVNVNINVPSCKDCKFHMITNTVPSKEKCKKYGEIDSFTGEVIFYELSKCRDDELRCGVKGVHFLPKDIGFNKIEN
jgi:hypothetical protein